MRSKCMLICQYMCYCCRPGSPRADAFRGHGFSLLALAKGMSTLFAKHGFSRPSLKYCGGFRHVLFPQDKEGLGSINIARRKLVCIFEESTVLRSKHHVNEGNTRRLLPMRPHNERPLRVRRLIASPRKA